VRLEVDLLRKLAQRRKEKCLCLRTDRIVENKRVLALRKKWGSSIKTGRKKKDIHFHESLQQDRETFRGKSSEQNTTGIFRGRGYDAGKRVPVSLKERKKMGASEGDKKYQGKEQERPREDSIYREDSLIIFDSLRRGAAGLGIREGHQGPGKRVPRPRSEPIWHRR